ncbi:MAG: fibronectin type III domain-containing protein, partial [Kineosporiaceae bacterium]|nr:fibronectin type III domain-containing protein [Kineosporiaceae bacterium]
LTPTDPLTCTFTALTNGTTYTVTVTATNTNGTTTATTTAIPYPATIMTSTATKIWLDAQHSTSMSAATDCSGSNAATGTGIGCWKNRASTTWNATSGATKAVLTATAINGHPALRFNRTNPDYYSITNTGVGALGSADRSIFAVAIGRTTTNNTDNLWGGIATWPGTSGMMFDGYPNVTVLNGSSYGSGGAHLAPTVSLSGGQVHTAVSSSSGATLSQDASVAGRTPTTSSATIGPWMNYPDLLRIGSTFTTVAAWANNLDGDIGEVIILNRAVTTTERRQIQDYLARKWDSSITPQAATAVTATAGNTQASVSWTAPAWDGGSAITGYTATASPGGQTCTATPPSTSCTVTGLTAGTPYTFTVTATNSVGTGPASAASNSVTPTATTPDAPTDLTATASSTISGQASVTWTAPSDTGGSPITGYTATATPTAGTGHATLPDLTCSSASSPCTLTGLTDGITYTVTVTATNAIGTGTASSAATVTTHPASVLTSSAVELWMDADGTGRLYSDTACTTAAAAGSQVACWKDRSANGYALTQSTAANRPIATTVGGRLVPLGDSTDDLLSSTAATLPSGTTSSTAFVAATATSAGSGSDSWPLFWGTGGSGARRELWFRNTSRAVSAGTNSGTYATSGTWTQNALVIADLQHLSGSMNLQTNGAAAVSATTAVNTTGASTVHVGALFTGYTHEVIVTDAALTAADRRVVQEYLARKWATAITPSVPGTPVATAGVGDADITWTAPAWDGGSPITSYTATASPGGNTCTTTGTSCTITGLTNGTPHTVTVTATNSVGTGPASAASNPVTPTGPPGAPTGLTATASSTTSGQASLTWTAPASTGGSAITGYTATAAPTAGTGHGSLSNITCTSGSSPCTLTGLTDGITYSVTVTATNAIGTSTASAAATVTPYPATIMTGSAFEFWLDGADPATLYAADTCTGAQASTTVGCWRDKSPNANHATQTTSGNQPTLTTVATHSVPGFDGSNDRLGFSAALMPTGTTSSTEFVVAAHSSPTNGSYSTVLDWGGTGAGQTRTLFKAPTTGVVQFDNRFGPGSTSGTWSTAPTLAAAEAAGAGSTIRSATDGRSWSSATAVTFSTATTTGSLGSSVATDTFWQGPVAETVVLSGTLTTAQKRVVEEYLARKWGATITPAAPTVTTTPGDGQATISWTAPAWDGGAAVTSYTATASPGGTSCSTASTSCTLSGLTNGIEYTVSVTATNAVGAGPPGTATATSYPTTLFASADLRVWLDARHPASLSPAVDCSGSGATTGSGVGCWKDRSGNGWLAPRGGSASPVLTDSAINGLAALRMAKATADHYEITASGIGAIGSADRSIFVVANPRTTYGTVGTNNAAILAAWGGWNTGLLAHAYGGTTTIDSVQGDFYTTGAGSSGYPATSASGTAVFSAIYASAAGTLTGGVTVNGRGALSSASLSGSWFSTPDDLNIGAAGTPATADYAYPLDGDIGEVLVFDRALNPSERRTVEEYLARHWSQTIAPAAPGTPTATAGSGQASVSWSAPSWNGGASVTGYTVTSTPGNKSCSTASTSCTVTGLTAGIGYTFTVSATNSAGAGPASAQSNTVSPS